MNGKANGSMRTLLAGVVLVALMGGGCSQGGAASPAVPSPATPSSAASAAPATASPGAVTPAPSASATVPATPAPSVAATEPWPVPGKGSLSKVTAERLQAFLERIVAKKAAPGIAAAVVTADGTWVGAAGVDGAGTAIQPTSAFGIGSTSKTLTAAEVLLLASKGSIDLDTPVADMVDLPFDARGATIRQLGTMQSGFPRISDEELEVSIGKDLLRTWTIPDLLARINPAEVPAPVGGPGKYNGLNYQVLSMVIAKATGSTFDQVIRRDLLEPAGLDRMWTQTGEKPVAPLAIAVDPGTGIVDAKSGYLPSLAAASTGNGAAGMAADAPTLARWGYLLYGGQVIDPALVGIMVKPNWSSDFGYGFGTMCDNSSGTLVVGHAGDYMGYSSIVLAWAGTHTSIAILVPKEGLSADGTVPGWGWELYGVLMAPA